MIHIDKVRKAKKFLEKYYDENFSKSKKPSLSDMVGNPPLSDKKYAPPFDREKLYEAKRLMEKECLEGRAYKL